MALFIFSKRFFVHWDEKKATPFFKFYHCSNDMGSCSSRTVPNSLQHNTTTYWTMSNEISSQWLLSIYFIVVQVTLLTSTWSLYFNFKYQFYFGKKIFLYLQFTKQFGLQKAFPYPISSGFNQFNIPLFMLIPQLKLERKISFGMD